LKKKEAKKTLIFCLKFGQLVFYLCATPVYIVYFDLRAFVFRQSEKSLTEMGQLFFSNCLIILFDQIHIICYSLLAVFGVCYYNEKHGKYFSDCDIIDVDENYSA